MRRARLPRVRGDEHNKYLSQQIVREMLQLNLRFAGTKGVYRLQVLGDVALRRLEAT